MNFKEYYCKKMNEIYENSTLENLYQLYETVNGDLKKLSYILSGDIEM
jgi:hypothetical protein